MSRFAPSTGFWSGGAGTGMQGGSAAPAPHAPAAGVPRVKDPTKTTSVKKEGGGVKLERSLKAKLDEEPEEPESMFGEFCEIDEEADDGQPHPPLRLPLRGKQNLYMHQSVNVTQSGTQAEARPLGHEDAKAIAADERRAKQLFHVKDDDDNDKLFFVQLPSALPISKMMEPEQLARAESHGSGAGGSAPPETAEGAEGAGAAVEDDRGTNQPASMQSSLGQSEWTARLHEADPGYMGKLQIHKSGKMYLVLGDVKYDVIPGTQCHFRQEVLIVDSEQKSCHALGAVQERLICKLQTSSLLPSRGPPSKTPVDP